MNSNKNNNMVDLLNNIYEKRNLVGLLNNMIKCNNMPNILICGPIMSGKTFIMNAISTKIYKNDDNVLNISLIEDSGINIIKEKIKNYSKQINGINIGNVKWKIILLDDAHLLSFDSQLAISHIMELYSKNIKFIITTNNINKIINSLKSRCSLLNIRSLDIQKSKRIYNIISNDDLDMLFDLIKQNDTHMIMEFVYKISDYPLLDQTNIFLEYILKLNISETKKIKIVRKLCNIHHNVILQNSEFTQYLNLIFFIVMIYNNN